MVYTMVIQVLTKFQLKITMIGEAIAKKVIFNQIWPIFESSLVQIVPKIPVPDTKQQIFQISGVYHSTYIRSTSTGGVSALNNK